MQIATEPIFEAILDIELTNGNDGRQKSWYKPAKERKFFESLLVARGLRRKPFNGPVVVVVTRILGQGQRLWDSSSGLRGNYKELEDNLKSMIVKEPFSWQKFVERVIRWNYLAGNKSHDHSDEKYDNQLRLVREEFKEVLEAMPVNGKIPLEHYLYEKFGKEAGRNVARIVYCFDTAREAFK